MSSTKIKESVCNCWNHLVLITVSILKHPTYSCGRKLLLIFVKSVFPTFNEETFVNVTPFIFKFLFLFFVKDVYLCVSSCTVSTYNDQKRIDCPELWGTMWMLGSELRPEQNCESGKCFNQRNHFSSPEWLFEKGGGREEYYRFPRVFLLDLTCSFVLWATTKSSSF